LQNVTVKGKFFSGIESTGLSRAGGTASGGREERLAASGGRLEGSGFACSLTLGSKRRESYYPKSIYWTK